MSQPQRSADVVIVGAGVTGWMLAAVLAPQNVTVAVLEQQYQRPRDGSFAGVVTAADFTALGIGRPPADTLWPLQQMVEFSLSANLAPPARAVSDADTIRHDDLLQWLRSEALSRGVVFEQASTVTQLRWHGGAVAGVVAGDAATAWNARVVVLADESDPRLAEEPGLRPDWSPTQLMHIAKQCFEKRDDLSLSLDGKVPVAVFSGETTWGQAGFGTLIPWKETWTLTVAMRLEDEMTSSHHISEFADEARVHPAIAPAIMSLEPGALVTEVIPIGGVADPARLSGDGVLVLGDAVGLTHPLNRDGLSSNVDVARLAAATIVDARRSGDFSSISLSRFDDRVRDEVIDPLRRRAEAASLSADDAWSLATMFQPLAGLAQACRQVNLDGSGRSSGAHRPVSLRQRLAGLGKRTHRGD